MDQTARALAVFVFLGYVMSKNDIEDGLELGTWLGRRQAFSIVAGRCSAADAQCLRELRESKKYRKLGLTWEQCCKQRAGIGRSTADEIIRNLEEFGPDYFVIAQVTGISSKEYRRIHGSVSNHKLLHGGQEIPIAPENATRLAVAIEELRRESAAVSEPAADPETDVARAFAKTGRTLEAAVAELDRLRLMPLDVASRARLRSLVTETIGKLQFIDVQVKV